MTPIAIVGYLALFAGTAFSVVLVALWIGRFLRPNNPYPEKLEAYECGEPPVGSAFVQFDLRFYVVALVFIIFEVEVAFFFPWADVYGKVTRLSDPSLPAVEAEATYRELSAADSTVSTRPAAEAFRQLALAAIADIAVFFGVLLVGFAYLWRRGDLDWVRAMRPSEPTSGRPGQGVAL